MPASSQPAVYDSSRRPHPFVEEWQELWRFRELALLWSLRTIKIRYKRSVLGVLWTLLEPLMTMTILTVVFSALFRISLDDYPVYVLAGLALFDFFRRSTVAMADEMLASQGLASRIHIARSVFPVAAVLTYVINWLLALIPLAFLMLFLGRPFTPALLTLPPAIVVNAVFALGVGMIIATLAAFFPDVNLTYQVLLTAWMYATPIIYPIEIVGERWRPLLELNPLTHLLRLVRDPIYEGVVASGSAWAISVTLATGALVAGWWTFTRWRDAFDYRP